MTPASGWLTPEISLAVLNTHIAHHRQILRGLDSLGYDFAAEGLTDAGVAAEVGDAVRIGADPDHAALVDLDHVRLQHHQAFQATAAVTDIVDGDHQSGRSQRIHDAEQI